MGPIELVRFRLPVRPVGRSPYAAEVNGYVRVRSRSKFQPDQAVRVRFDPAGARRLVLIGPVE